MADIYSVSYLFFQLKGLYNLHLILLLLVCRLAFDGLFGVVELLFEGRDAVVGPSCVEDVVASCVGVDKLHMLLGYTVVLLVAVIF